MLLLLFEPEVEQSGPHGAQGRAPVPAGEDDLLPCGKGRPGNLWVRAGRGSLGRCSCWQCISRPFSKRLSPCRPLTGIAAFSSELLLTSGITLHVRIFVKTAVQHKDKKSGIFSGRTCGFSRRRAPSSLGRLGCKLGGGSARGTRVPQAVGACALWLFMNSSRVPRS